VNIGNKLSVHWKFNDSKHQGFQDILWIIIHQLLFQTHLFLIQTLCLAFVLIFFKANTFLLLSIYNFNLH